MTKRLLIVILLLGALAARAEIIDRIAVTVDRIVITESDILNQIRIASFLDGSTLDTEATARREAAERMVEQVLVRREMEISRYPAPAMDEIAPLLAQVRETRSLDDAAYRQALEEYGVTDGELREGLLLQLTVLRFIEYRFRPGVTLTDEEVEAYYRDSFVPQWTSQNSSAAPPLDDVRDDLEEILIQDQVDEALDEWLAQAKGMARIRYRTEAFE